jgi:FlgD Ig-like domain
MISRPLKIAVLACVVWMTGCGSRDAAPPSAQATKPAVVISQVRVDRTAFDPAKQETVTLRFNLSEPADVALVLYDGRDHQVYRQDAKGLSAGDSAFVWNGQDGFGRPVPAEAYTYTLIARNAKGQSIHDLTDLTGGAAVTATDVRWDAATGTVRYVLDRPARVNLRLGLEAGPYLRTVIDWVPRGAGAHAERWDGRDASGVLNLANNPALTPVIKAYALPDNTLFVGAPPDRLQFIAERDATILRERNGPPPVKRMFDNSQQPLESRGDLPALLGVGGGFKQDSEGRWVVSGDVPLTANVPDADRQRVLQRRFEAVFYVDGVFAHENELGYLPLTWTWNTAQFNPGEHFVTLNIRGYEGNFGTATIKVLVEPPSAPSPTHAAAPQVTP